MLYLVEMLGCSGAATLKDVSQSHIFFWILQHKNHLKQYYARYYVSIPPNRAPTVSQMDQDLLDNSQKDE